MVVYGSGADCQELERRESFLRDNTRSVSVIDPTTWSRPWSTSFAAVAGGVLSWKLYTDWARKPFFYSFTPRLAVLAFLGGAGYLVGYLREHHYKTRDAIVEHYVSLHPEDFTHLTKLDGRKFSEVFMPWIPRRAHHRKFD